MIRDTDDTDDLERIADALELQNALLLEVVHQLERGRADRRNADPDDVGRSDHSLATDVVDKYGDLYGATGGRWEFEPVDDRIENMGDR